MSSLQDRVSTSIPIAVPFKPFHVPNLCICLAFCCAAAATAAISICNWQSLRQHVDKNILKTPGDHRLLLYIYSLVILSHCELWKTSRCEYVPLALSLHFVFSLLCACVHFLFLLFYFSFSLYNNRLQFILLRGKFISNDLQTYFLELQNLKAKNKHNIFYAMKSLSEDEK